MNCHHGRAHTGLAIALSALLAVAFVGAAAVAADSAVAEAVYGQPSFSSGSPNSSGISATSLYFPGSALTDSQGNLYVGDLDNNRVLFYPKASTTATRVYGQPTLTSGGANHGGISASSMSYPDSVALDSADNLFVTDYNNNRVLFYPHGSTVATRVYGQSNFNTGTANPGGANANTLSHPTGVAVDGSGGLYVADSWNNRVLFYASGATVATRVYGQPNYTSTTANNGGITAGSLNTPYGLALDASGRLYVSDPYNNRILVFAPGSTSAIDVYGQPSFSSGAANHGGVSASSLRMPNSLSLDAGGGLYVADSLNSRVLYFPAGSKTASRVWGQPNFTTAVYNNGGVNAGSLSWANGVAIDGDGNLYVADTNNSRVLRFAVSPPEPPSSASSVNFVQAAATSTGARVGSTTLKLAHPVAAGDLLVGWFGQYDTGGQVHVSDSVNGAWARAGSEYFTNNRGDVALYYVHNSTAAPAIPITLSADAPAYLLGSAAEYSGVAAGLPEAVAIGRGNSTKADSGSTGVVGAGDLVYGALITGGNPSGFTPGTSLGLPFSRRASTRNGTAGDADILASAAGPQEAQFSLGAPTNWYAVAATFRHA